MLDMSLSERYTGSSDEKSALRHAVISACSEHFEVGLGDDHLAERLCDKSENVYWQALSEVMIALQIRRNGITPVHSRSGPDFLIEFKGQRVWIEVICPEPNGIPSDWTVFESGRVNPVPHEAILLRWTSAIKEKSEKLIGSRSNLAGGYLKKGIVQESDAYVIAVNGRLLRSSFPSLVGVSQFPFAVEAVLPVGPLEIKIDRETMEPTRFGNQFRNRVPKANGAEVPTDVFLDPWFAPVSAIWATDMDESMILGRQIPMSVVHNPLAKNPLFQGLLPAQDEYVAKIEGEFFRIETLRGS
ncbi:MAG: hypothetical protein IOD05_09580 [Rhodobacter sp.]|nr:hypothetical protein [Rhodobacter sp.]